MNEIAKETDLQPLEKSNCSPCAILQNVAAEINTIHKKFKHAEAEATIHAVKLGVLIEFAKETLKHGQLLPWIDENCEFSRQHTDRFRNIAKKFLKEQGINAGQLFLGQPLVKTIGGADKVVSCDFNEEASQMLFEFIGDRTLPELCEDLNVRWRDKLPYNPGGDTTGKGTDKPLPEGETSQHLMATGLLGKLQHEINVLVVTEYSQIIKHLDERELKDLFDTFALAAKAIDSQMKAL